VLETFASTRIVLTGVSRPRKQGSVFLVDHPLSNL